MKLLVTHHAPDIDAITSVWLLKRFDPQQYADAKILFVDAGKKLPVTVREEHNAHEEDITHVDTGEEKFDHHQTDRGMQRVSAASLVYDDLIARHPELKDDWALQQVAEYAVADDHFEDYFWPEASHERYLFTLRWILHGLEYTQLHDDDSQTVFGMKCLDGIYASLKERKRAMEVMDEGIEFSTKWGKGIGLLTSNQAVLRYAQMKGFNLVIQKDPRQGNIRIKAAPLPGIDLTALHETILKKDTKGSWFFHKGRHMVLNGSQKISQKPSPLSLEEVIEIAKNIV
ncbi:MAG: hypothetical protein A2804_00735 [Candidatus Pacebacteria bacterium RIFCSPHIGHO2_01_FULL_46_10]|nr:MAG: hypothetical protein A2804_00735 [Candidatus Pacebacteria bacterium RIFCSPHIGHO2_01_FULL_46_10]